MCFNGVLEVVLRKKVLGHMKAFGISFFLLKMCILDIIVEPHYRSVPLVLVALLCQYAYSANLSWLPNFLIIFFFFFSF